MNDRDGQPFERERMPDLVENRRPDARPVQPDTVPAADWSQVLLDRTRYDELMALVEPDRIRTALVAFRDDLQAHFGCGSEPGDPDNLTKMAHRLISPAGVLGFGPLAASLAAFEVAVRAGGAILDCVQDVRNAAHRALPLIEALIAEAEEECGLGPDGEATDESP